MSTEIELKLSVPAARAGMLWKTRALARLPHAPPMTRRLFSAYYDTKDFALHAAGVTVRLRREAGRWVQTVKGGGEASGGLHSRSESEERVPAQLLNLPALAQAGLGELLERGALHRGLGVVFATQVRRTTTMVEPLPGSRVELSLDRGEIVAGVRREPLCEIELELKSGSTDALFSLASALAHELPLRLDNASKAQRGYRLAIGERATPAKAAPVALPGSATVDEGFRTVAFACLQQLQANESGVLHSPDPEYVHQARVALRRLRSAFTAFSGAVPKDFFSAQFGALRALAATLGEARDWDVFVGQTLRQAAGGGAIPAALARLKRRAAAQRRRARSAAKQALENADYTLLLIDLVRMLHAGDWVRSRTPEQAQAAREDLARFAARSLARRDARLRSRADEAEDCDPAAVHRLRIEAKKLRYACEFFGGLFAHKKVRGYLSRLLDLQELLGAVNDAATTHRLLETLAERGAKSDCADALSFLHGYTAARMQARLDALPAALGAVVRAKPFW
ncbi:MAG TPA: CHAD domain-containing protein [Burkholderiales bacterium]|nr:CHAD domain-containing protein [Burkholderiales bacterium]